MVSIHFILRRFSEFLLGHPLLILGCLIASAVGSLLLARDLKFDFSPQSIYRGNDALLEYSEQFKRTFGYDDTVLLIIVKATGSNDVLSVPGLQWQVDLADDLKKVPQVVQIESVATIETPRFSLAGPVLRPLIDDPVVDESVVELVHKTLAGSQMARGGLLSEDDRIATLAVFLDPAAREIDDLKRVVGRVNECLQRHPAPTGFEVLTSGLPAIRIQIVDDLARDMATLIPVGGVVYLIVLALMFRRISGAILPIFAVGIGLTWTLAAFALMHDSFNLVSNVLPILLMIIGVSSCVQIVNCYAEESAAGKTRWIAAREAIARMAAPAMLVAITTAVGFASLCTARSELLSRFGMQAAVGIAFQYISTILTLGALFRFFAPPAHSSDVEVSPSIITRFVTFLGHTVARRSWVTLVCAIVVISFFVWMGTRVQINSYPVSETFTESHPTIKTLRLIEHDLKGIMQLEISLTADKPDMFLQPEVFHRVVKLEQAAKQGFGVLDVQSYTDLFREILHGWPGRKPTETDLELVPLSETGNARLERTDVFIERFPGAFHYRSHLSEDGMRIRLRIRLREIGSREMLITIRELESKMLQIFPKEGPIKAAITGDGYVNAIALTVLIRDLFYALLTASLVIFVLITVEFRSIRTGVIAALPNLTPLAVTLGYMGLRGYDMNVANVIAFTICLGLADDNTIYFLYRFRQEYAACGNTVEAVRLAFLGTGRAIVLTSILLLVGMAVLFCSNFLPTRRFAELTSVTILGNLVGVLLLLPACLVIFSKRSTVSHSAPGSN